MPSHNATQFNAMQFKTARIGGTKEPPFLPLSDVAKAVVNGFTASICNICLLVCVSTTRAQMNENTGNLRECERTW